jgi:hypothetical protein
VRGLPGIDRFSLAFEFGLKHIGKRQIHVVAAQQNNERERASFTAVLLPLAEGSVAIDHVLGAMNYRSLNADEMRSTQVRLPTPRIARFCPL